MKKLLTSILVLVAVAFFATGTASASTFTLNETALLMLWETYENPVNNVSSLFFVTNDAVEYGTTMSEDVGYVGTLRSSSGNPYAPFAQMQIGANYWGVSGALGTSGATTAQVIGASLGIAPTNSLVGFDKYALILENDNDDYWSVNIHMNTGYNGSGWNEPNNYYESTWTQLAPDTSVSLILDLTNVANLNHVTNIGFNVGGNMTGIGGNPSNPDVFHTSASPVPEPSSMLMLGTGLMGLIGGAFRKKFVA